MNAKTLIDAIVHQNMVLVAQLSTAAGLRAPLAHVANQVFLDLVRELESQGVRQRVIADMFGLALRSYQRKVQRLMESRTEHGRSLWEAVLSFVQEADAVPRAAVLRRFRHDDEAMVRGVLDDLVETGLVYRRGRGDSTIYRAAREDSDDLGGFEAPEADAAMIWVKIYREGPLDRTRLGETLRLQAEAVEAGLRLLLADNRLVVEGTGDSAVFRCNAFFADYEQSAGWEAALLDHYQTVVQAIATKLRMGSTRARRDDEIGGSTYSFDVWPGHPFEKRVRGLLRRVRDEADLLLEEVHRHNEALSRPPGFTRVSFYVGQSKRSDDLDPSEDA